MPKKPDERVDLPALLKTLGTAVELGPTTLKLTDPNMTFDQYERLVAGIGNFYKASKFWGGDVLLAGEVLFGEEGYQAAHHLGITEGALQDWVRVARLVPPERRRGELSWSHHRSVAPLEPAQQIAMLDRAVSERLDVRGLNDLLGQLELTPGLSPLGTDSRHVKAQVVELVLDAAEHVYHQAQRMPDGDYRVPPEPMARLAAALGEED